MDPATAATIASLMSSLGSIFGGGGGAPQAIAPNTQQRGLGAAPGGDPYEDILVDTTQRESGIEGVTAEPGFFGKLGRSVIENPQVQGQLAESLLKPEPPPAGVSTSLRSSFTAGQNPYEVARERAMRRMRTRRRF